MEKWEPEGGVVGEQHARRELVALYESYAPKKLDDPDFVDSLLRKWEGKHELLLRTVRNKYGQTVSAAVSVPSSPGSSRSLIEFVENFDLFRGDTFNLDKLTFNLDKLAELIYDYIGNMDGDHAVLVQTALFAAGGFRDRLTNQKKFIIEKMKEFYGILNGVYKEDIENITYSELCKILSEAESRLLKAISKKIIEEIKKTDAVDLDSQILSAIPSEGELSSFFPFILYLLWAIKGGTIHSDLHNGGGKSKRRKRSRKRNSKRSKRRSKTKYKKKTRRIKKKY
jgi:hypothetical protein